MNFAEEEEIEELDQTRQARYLNELVYGLEVIESKEDEYHINTERSDQRYDTDRPMVS